MAATLKTILVIEDNDAYRADLVEILGWENYATLQADNGRAGLELIREHGPDLIICDVDMPVMGGLDVLRQVKTDSPHTQIPFVIVSGHNDDVTVNTAMSLGATLCLTKPISINALLSAVNLCLHSAIVP